MTGSPGANACVRLDRRHFTQRVSSLTMLRDISISLGCQPGPSTHSSRVRPRRRTIFSIVFPRSYLIWELPRLFTSQSIKHVRRNWRNQPVTRKRARRKKNPNRNVVTMAGLCRRSRLPVSCLVRWSGSIRPPGASWIRRSRFLWCCR